MAQKLQCICTWPTLQLIAEKTPPGTGVTGPARHYGLISRKPGKDEVAKGRSQR